MEQQFNTSFIPKKSLQEDVDGGLSGKYVNRRSVHGPGFYLMLLILIITIFFASGLFVYTKKVEKGIESKLVQLDRNRVAYQTDTINTLKRVDVRMKQVNELVKSHRAVSGIMDDLEDRTLKTVRYSSLKIAPAKDAADVGAMVLSIEGDTYNIKTVAVQADEYRSSEGVQSYEVKKLGLSDLGGVIFGLDLFIKPEALLYSALTKEKGDDSLGDDVPIPEPIAAPEGQSMLHDSQEVVGTTTDNATDIR